MVKLFDDVYFYRHKFGANCNIIAFKDGNDLDLIDTGIAKLGIVQSLWKEMRRDNLDPTRVRRIYHCHYHFDHVQSDVLFQQKATKYINKIPVFVPKPDLFRTKKDFSIIDWNIQEIRRNIPNAERDFKRVLYSSKMVSPLLITPQPDNICSMDNHEKITLGKRTGVLYTTGGHTEGHSFIHINDADNILITSDHDAMNEYTSDWGKILNSVRLAQKLNPDNVIIGHNNARIGHESSMNFINSYFTQFDNIFAPLLSRFEQGKQVNLSHIIHSMMGWKYKIQIVDFWAHMALYAIGKYLQEIGLGKMYYQNHQLSFNIEEDPEKIDIIGSIREGVKNY